MERHRDYGDDNDNYYHVMMMMMMTTTTTMTMTMSVFDLFSWLLHVGVGQSWSPNKFRLRDTRLFGSVYWSLLQWTSTFSRKKARSFFQDDDDGGDMSWKCDALLQYELRYSKLTNGGSLSFSEVMQSKINELMSVKQGQSRYD